MSNEMSRTDRTLLVAAQLAAAMTEPGDDAKDAVDNLAEVLKEIRSRGGATKIYGMAARK